MENQNQSIFIKFNKNKELIGTVSEIPYFNNFIMKIKDKYFKTFDSLPEIRLQYEDDDNDLCMLQNQEDYDIMIEMQGPVLIKMALDNEASLSSIPQDSFIVLDKKEEISQTQQQQQPKLEIAQNITDEECQRKMSMENFDDIIDSQEIENVQNDVQKDNDNSVLSQENIEMQNENDEIKSDVIQEIQKDVQEEKSDLNENQEIQKEVIENEKKDDYQPMSDQSIMRVIASVPEQEKENHLEDLYNKIKEESLMKKEKILKDELQDQNEFLEEEKVDNVNELLNDALNQDPSQMMIQNITEHIRKSAFHIENSQDPLGEIQTLINTLQQQHEALKIEKEKLQQKQQKDKEWWVLKGAKDIFSSINPFQKPQISKTQKQKIFKQKFDLLKEIYQFDNQWNEEVEKFVNANITVSDSQLAEGFIAHLIPALEKKESKQKI